MSMLKSPGKEVDDVVFGSETKIPTSEVILIWWKKPSDIRVNPVFQSLPGLVGMERSDPDMIHMVLTDVKKPQSKRCMANLVLECCRIRDYLMNQ
jgi:hypothetical protein